MNDYLNFETYLYISLKKFIISVNSNSNEKIYNEEFLLDQNSKSLDFDKLNYFLNENIFQIEKNLKKFVEKIYIIIDLDNFFPVEISLKRKNFDSVIDPANLNYLLFEAKDCCKKTINDSKIVHMIIKNYQIDNKDYSNFPNNISGKNFSLDIKFICISDSFVKKLENVLKKYQISLSQILSANYIKEFLKNNDEDMFLMAKKLINGHNSNEVLLVNKTSKNVGFFEKFFNFFN